jgi:hypothetical protein
VKIFFLKKKLKHLAHGSVVFGYEQREHKHLGQMDWELSMRILLK